jgi:tRNA (uracil-5-)-methyltransferase TRM9
MIRYNRGMDEATAAALLRLNRQFYQTFASQFSATRQRLQPGIQRLLPLLAQVDTILDLGCGNGELANQLFIAGFNGSYTGLDFSERMLAETRQRLSVGANIQLIQTDLGEVGWDEAFIEDSFQAVSAFAVLHHLPGKQRRINVLQAVRRLVNSSGRVILSNWQFLSSTRLKARIQPWEKAGLRQDQVDPGDYLLDWRQGGSGLRYAHNFTEAELAELAQQTSFEIMESYLSDGENGRLGLYQIWKPV